MIRVIRTRLPARVIQKLGQVISKVAVRLIRVMMRLQQMMVQLWEAQELVVKGKKRSIWIRNN